MKYEYKNSDIIRVIDEHIHSERDRRILKRRFVDGKTYGEIADKEYLSERQIKKIVYKHELKIFNILQK